MTINFECKKCQREFDCDAGPQLHAAHPALGATPARLAAGRLPDVIRAHPGLSWKALNVRKHRGF